MVFSNSIVFKNLAEGNSKSHEKQAGVPRHSYCKREAKVEVTIINVAKHQVRTAVISAYVLFSRLHVRREKVAYVIY